MRKQIQKFLQRFGSVTVAKLAVELVRNYACLKTLLHNFLQTTHSKIHFGASQGSSSGGENGGKGRAGLLAVLENGFGVQEGLSWTTVGYGETVSSRGTTADCLVRDIHENYEVQRF